MDWDDLKVFLAVARQESLSAAGRTLRLDPATVGRRVTRLEERIGAALFLRSPQGYAPTEAALRLMAHAERIEAEVEAGQAGVAGPADRLTGTVRIGAPDGCATHLLPQVCAGLLAENPALDIQIVALPRVFNLSRREADLAVVVSPPAQGRMTVRKLASYRLSLAASRDYLARTPPIRSRADLARHRAVGYIPEMIFDSGLDYAREIEPATAGASSNSVLVQLGLIRAGAGVGIVHDFALPSAPDLVRVLPDEVRLERSFYLTRHADAAGSARLERVAERLGDGPRKEIARLEGMA